MLLGCSSRGSTKISQEDSGLIENTEASSEDTSSQEDTSEPSSEPDNVPVDNDFHKVVINLN